MQPADRGSWLLITAQCSTETGPVAKLTRAVKDEPRQEEKSSVYPDTEFDRVRFSRTTVLFTATESVTVRRFAGLTY